MTKKQEKVWAYKVKHPKATTKQIAEATNSSVSYVHTLMSKIGTPKEVLDSTHVLTDEGKPVSVSRGTEFDGYALNNKSPVTDRADARMDVPRETVTDRQAILDKASNLIDGDRADEYGDAQGNFERIATYWNTHLGLIDFISPTDVAVMMTLVKVSRLHGEAKSIDSFVDACGYMALGGEINCS
jgi:hypothetical protein